MNIVEKSHEIIAAYFCDKPLLYAIDATLGNGHDALFLAQISSLSAIVFGFDVQSAAIDASKNLLEKNSLTQKCKFFLTGHENMLSAIPSELVGRIDCIVFNLGWLPKSDKNVITRSNTTLRALNAAVKLLRDGGLLNVASYRGHIGGMEEFCAVKKFMETLSGGTQIFGDVENAQSPILFSSIIKSPSKN